MAHVDLIAPFVDKLNDMKAELCLHNLRHHLRISQVESNVGKLRHPLPTTCIPQFSTVTGRAILGIEAGQCRKRRLTTVDAVGIFTKFVLYTVDFRHLNTRRLGDNLHLHFSRDKRQTVLGNVLEIAAHFSWRDFDVFHKFLLHLLHHQLITVIIMQLCPHLADSLTLIFFQLLARACHLRPIFYLLVNA